MNLLNCLLFGSSKFGLQIPSLGNKHLLLCLCPGHSLLLFCTDPIQSLVCVHYFLRVLITILLVTSTREGTVSKTRLVTAVVRSDLDHAGVNSFVRFIFPQDLSVNRETLIWQYQ